MAPVEIHTNRLVLRPLRDSDLEDVLAQRAHPDVCRFIGAPMARDDVRRHIEARRNSWTGREGDVLGLAVELRDGARVAGEAVVRYVSAEARQAEIGCRLHPDHQARELGIEMCAGLLAFLFGDMQMHRVFAISDVDNVSVERLASRLHMSHEGTLRENAFRNGEWRDEHVFSILDREWHAVRASFQRFFP